jgi:hypothetical protein
VRTGDVLVHYCPVIDPQTLKRLDIRRAVEKELATGNRLLPRRPDLLLLAKHVDEVAAWLRPRLRKGTETAAADIILANKGWRGSRPLHSLALDHRVLYRAVVEELRLNLPLSIQNRSPIEEFRRAPLAVQGARYVSKTDVTAYYEYVDHEILLDELIAQTGDEQVVDVLGILLAQTMGRQLGLPQVSKMSDVLGDAYIDIARRRLLRKGYATFTYSDDFRMASSTLGEARAALEDCAHELRRLGLVMNERKTYTYGRGKYVKSLDAFRDAEARLFDGPDTLLLGDYADENAGELEEQAFSLSSEPIGGELDESELVIDEVSDEDGAQREPALARVQAAGKAWELWVQEEESEEVQWGIDAAITQSLLSLALPVLGAAGDSQPLADLHALLRYEPALTPQVAEYLIAYAGTGRAARQSVRDCLDKVVGDDILSSWQKVWLAYAAGALRGSRATRRHVAWLEQMVEREGDMLAGYAALALGRLGHGSADSLAAAIDRVGPAWRQLLLLGLAYLDFDHADRVAEHELDRLLLEGLSS